MFLGFAFCLWFVRWLSGAVAGWPPAAPPSLGVVVDAGSTGSRVHCLRHSRDQVTHVRPPLKITPGLSSFAGSPERDITQYLSAIFEEVDECIGGTGAPALFLATAGMRLLSDTEQSRLLSHIPARFREARVISGREEGVFLYQSVVLAQRAAGRTEQRVVAAMDLGGASHQVAFYDENNEMLVHSFLGWGVKQVERSLRDLKGFAVCLGATPRDRSVPTCRALLQEWLLLPDQADQLATARRLGRAMSRLPWTEGTLVCRDHCAKVWDGLGYARGLDADPQQTALLLRHQLSLRACAHSPRFCLISSWMYVLFFYAYQLGDEDAYLPMYFTDEIANEPLSWAPGALHAFLAR